MTFTLSWWRLFIGIPALEIAAVIVLTEVVCHFVPNARRQRICWQAALVGLAVIIGIEFSGVRASAPAPFPVQASSRHLKLRVTESGPAVPIQTDSISHSETANPPAFITWPASIWFAGTFILLFVGGATRLWLFLERRNMQMASEKTASIPENLLTQLGVRKVFICSWQKTRGPVAFGIFRPTVALPPDFDRRFDSQQRQVMLAHELAHLAARDPLWFAFTDTLCAIVWWHPLVWWMRRRFRRACESAADEASAVVPAGPAILAQSLVAFGRELSLPAFGGGLGVAGSGIRSDLGLRVKALLKQSTPWHPLPRSWRCVPWLGAILCGALVAVSPVHAASPLSNLGLFADRSADQPDAPKEAANTAEVPVPTAPLHIGPNTNSKGQAIMTSFVFVELPENDEPIKSELDSMFGPQPQDPHPQLVSLTNFFPKSHLPSQRNTTTELARTVSEFAILKTDKYLPLKNRILHQTGAHLVAMPRIETLPSCPASVSTYDAKSIVFDVQTINVTPDHQGSIGYETGEVQLGSTAAISTQPADGGLRLNVLATYSEFLGYDDPGNAVVEAKNWSEPGNSVRGILPLPHIRVSQTQASPVVKMGETVVLRGPLAIDYLKTKGRYLHPVRGKPSAHRLYVFVTVEAAKN